MTSSTSRRHRMRCNACRAAGRSSGRFTLRQHPDLYKRDVKCPMCGEKDRISSQEKDRRIELKRRPSHRCSAYPFPHQPGTLRMCSEHPEQQLGFEPTDDEKDDYQRVLDTPRSAFDWGVGDSELDLGSDFEDDDYDVPGFA